MPSPGHASPATCSAGCSNQYTATPGVPQTQRKTRCTSSRPVTATYWMLHTAVSPLEPWWRSSKPCLWLVGLLVLKSVLTLLGDLADKLTDSIVIGVKLANSIVSCVIIVIKQSIRFNSNQHILYWIISLDLTVCDGLTPGSSRLYEWVL